MYAPDARADNHESERVQKTRDHKDGGIGTMARQTGVRPPVWPASNANGKHTYSAPVVVFALDPNEVFNEFLGRVP